MIESARVWGVQALLLATSDALTARFGAATVQGELSGFTRAASGHCYFTLKDADGAAASMRCAMFRRSAGMLPFAPRDGMRVQLRGRVAVYEARGELQFVAEAMTLAGEGNLHELFLRLKAKLQAEGLFDDARKRSLPTQPLRVGVVTSLAAAALHDVATTLARRSPHVNVVLYPTPVQGADAPAAIVAALQLASTRGEVDVVLLVRGGGSLEDLWAFNDERVVRAVVASSIPVVVGVGHESDITLADLAGDLRAPTPTAAAEMAVASQAQGLAELAELHALASQRVARRLEQHAVRLDRAAWSAGKPAKALDMHHQRLTALAMRTAPSVRAVVQGAKHDLSVTATRLKNASRFRQQRDHDRLQAMPARLHAAVLRQSTHAQHELQQWQARLSALDPSRVLTRGYAWVTNAQGVPVTASAQLQVGDAIQAVFADGTADALVRQVVPKVQAQNKG
jgi:exodeoxyribonuclease VII large subunit